MTQLTHYLYEEQFQDAQHAGRLTVLELPNLLALLDWQPDHQPPEHIVGVAANMEGLLQNLGQPRALAQAVRTRERAAGQLTGWSRARHEAAAAEIDRLFDRGELPAAHVATQRLLEHHLTAGETAYPGADYDTASTYIRLGRILRSGGAAQAALAPLEQAQRRFQQLADTGDKNAAAMAAKAMGETGDCLRMLGRLDEAAAAYQDEIDRANRLGDRRDAAVAEAQLATVRLGQQRYPEALDGYMKAHDTFEALGEPRFIAAAWHGIGRVHEEAGQFDAAEDAYRHALAIRVREADLSGQADTLNQLGNLYAEHDRLEESVTFLQQAADIFTRSEDRAKEGFVRYNLAQALLDLRRYDGARQELQRAIFCKRDFGHAAQPWNAWSILADLEFATGDHDAAHTARQQAIDTYLAYRRDGGHSHSNLIQIYTAAAQAIADNQQDKLTRELNEVLGPDTPPWLTAPIRAVHAVLAGQRDPTLADDPDINPINAAELLLLLDTVAPQDATTTPG
jgi:tetratricopeptide (TPR) repeat protein